ncbi:MAG: type II toxin-antitoxin system VapC family toxin [Verrucomicrobia bacterium]|nr:MAG: type II toxin-antitoxin system VapC family toxin [Verrucomicrobiota bacterium]
MGTMPQTRIAFADANWLVATYHVSKTSPIVQAWADAAESTLIVSAPVLAEAQCNFWRIGKQWPELLADVRSGKFVMCGQSFESLVSLSDDLFRRFGPRCNVGTMDILHLAAARRFGCQWFLSFDSNSGMKALAHVIGMKVFPELNEQDKDWVSKLK